MKISQCQDDMNYKEAYSGGKIMGKTLCLLGGSGFIATNIAIEAISRGYKIVAFDNLSRKDVDNNLRYMQERYPDDFEFVWGDVRKRGDFEKIPRVDAVINLAANPSVVKSIEFPGYDFETNCGGVVNSLDWVRSRGNIPYLYASTNKVYSDITNEIDTREEEKKYKWSGKGDAISWDGVNRISDGDKLVAESINDKFPIDGFGKFGHSLYGVGKLAGELYVQEYHLQFGIPVVIFRMSCIYGLHQLGVLEQAWIDWFLRQIMLGDGKITFFGNGKQVRDVLDGRDTARAYMDALENIDKVNGEIFTLGGGKEHSYSLIETVEMIEKLTGKKADISYDEKRPADQDVYVSSLKKIKEMLGWEPEIGLEEALKDMIAEYEKEENR